MQPNASPLGLMLRIGAKEMRLFFASPTAYVFLACFGSFTLFVFFWGEAFFARNIADVRPLFEWMPILLIFLSSALSMRLWSEERRTGTLEHVFTQPIPLFYFVAGKFLACVALLGLALLITLPLPLTVAVFGDLDWGPVLAGYLATFLLGAAYLSIGLFASARTDNQIVSMLTATLLCGFIYMLGTGLITDLFSNRIGDWLRLLGTGSRFDAITRGVVDLRDLYYYLSLIAVFLVLNTYVLEKERWTSKANQQHRRWKILAALLIANILVANIWFGQLRALRIDVTEGEIYSISDATRSYLGQLREPMLLRAYFSDKTHPLLAPLVPQLSDLLREYEVAGNGKVRVEFIDPLRNPELEEEANQKYGIQPVPFQVADRYQASIVSSYFNVLIHYGDEFEVLGYEELVEVSARSESDLDVQLRNPELDITRAIRKVLGSYQAGGNLFDTVNQQLSFVAYVSPDDELPEPLADFKRKIIEIVAELQAQAQGRLSVSFLDPNDGNGELAAELAEQFGFKPMTTSLLSDERFYFYLTLGSGDQVVQIPMDGMDAEIFSRNLNAAVKRFASGFSKTLGIVVPQSDPRLAQFGMGGIQFTQLERFLAAETNVKRVDPGKGTIGGDIDLLLLVAPADLNDLQLFAIDQFLMRGGTVIAVTSPFAAKLSNEGISVADHNSGIENWLRHNGLKIGKTLIMDPQNAAFPVPVTRDVGGYEIQELRMLDYPYFVDVRADGLNQDNPISAELPQLTMAWASPIELATDTPNERTVSELIRSTDNSWLSATTNVMPRVGKNGLSGFAPEGELASHLIGVISEGRFDSFFSGRESPLLGETGASGATEKSLRASAVIERSPESARIILFSSNDFLNDQVTQLVGAAGGAEYQNTLQLMGNAVDWALEDSGLLSIRARSHFNRTLPPMDKSSQLFWEYLNYGLALLILALIAFVQNQRRKSRESRYKVFAAEGVVQ